MKLLYQFSAGDSFLHRLDPRTKLVFVVCFLISTFLLPHPWVMPLVIIAIIWILGRVSPLEYFVFILFLLPLMTAIVLIHLLTDGPPYFDARLLGVIPISTPGWDAGLLVAFRLARSEEHTSELQSLAYLVCRLLLEKKKKKKHTHM